MGKKEDWSINIAVKEAGLLDQKTPYPFTGKLEQCSPAESYSRGHKRMKILSEGKDSSTSISWIPRLHAETKCMDGMTSQDVEISDPFALPKLLEGLDHDKYGSVTKDIKDILARRIQLLNTPLLQRDGLDTGDFLKGRPKEVCKSLNRQLFPSATASASHDIIDVEDDCTDGESTVHIPGLDHEKYGSVTKDIKDILARKMQLSNTLYASNNPLLQRDGLDTGDFLKGRPKEVCKSSNRKPFGSAMALQDIIDLEDDCIAKDVPMCENSIPFHEHGGESTVHVPGDISPIDHNQSDLLKYLQSHSNLPIVILGSDEEDGDSISAGHDSSSKLAASNFEIPLESQKNGRGDLKNGVAMMADTSSLLNDAQYERGNSELVDSKVDRSDVVEENRDPSYQYQKVVLRKPVEEKPIRDLYYQHGNSELMDAKVDQNDAVEENRDPSYWYQKVYSRKPVEEKAIRNLCVREHGEGNIPKGEDERPGGEKNSGKEQGVYIGVQDDSVIEKSNHQSDEDDGLGDIWRELTLALECSKDAAPESSSFEYSEGGGGEECSHSFVLKDDLGYVCRVCGIIERGIETIFDFQWIKGTKTTRTYFSESHNFKDRQQTEVSPFSGIEVSQEDLTVAEMSVHPRHRQQMKPHQIEGFNFLQRNLITDKPGGCILAHAPGSGKTFMIISFMQSFLARYPRAKPLVILPKGILATWRKEFQRWQVEDIPLYDFYSSKAENRHQQLEVLKTWVDQNGILFLGYKQFANIVYGNATSKSKTAAACHDILLKVPTILILDEGHTPRNEDTNVLQSLAQVQTPRKVVLSGTLFQNHVKEVFNILNLVRPKFLKLESSRPIVKRVLSRVHISGGKKFFKNGMESAFFELVEDTLQNDDDFKRKVTVIQDLREMTNNVLHYYKGDILEELPGFVDFTVLLNLTSKQKKAVEKLKNLEKFKRSSVGSAVYMHPRLKEFSETATAVDRGGNFSYEKIDDLVGKLDVKDGVKTRFFLNLLGLCESAGEKLLVFSQYLPPLRFLERLIVATKGWSPGKEIFMISGDSTPEQREWAMDRFNKSLDAKVFFGSIKACGEGISLVGASRVLILDVHLNPSVTRQAIGRAFRPGQERKVYTYRLVAADSPEEEDHLTCFRKELIAKMWFEWSECCGHREFKMESVDVRECGDLFLESPLLRGDVKALYKR